MPIYKGVNGQAALVNKIYYGVSGVPKRIKYGYIGVGGKAKLFYRDDYAILDHSRLQGITTIHWLNNIYTNNKTTTAYSCNVNESSYNIYSNKNLKRLAEGEYFDLYTEADYIYLTNNCYRFFSGIRSSLNYINVLKFDFVTKAYEMFHNSFVYDKINFYNVNFNQVLDARHMFANSRINIPYLYLKNAKEIAEIFLFVNGTVNIKNVFFPNATNWSWAFASCNFLNNSTFSIPSHVKNISNIFRSIDNCIKGPLYINQHITEAKDIFSSHSKFIGNFYINSSFGKNFNFSFINQAPRYTASTRVNIILQNALYKKMAYTNTTTGTGSFDVSTAEKLNLTKINIVTRVLYPSLTSSDKTNINKYWFYNASNNCFYNSASNVYIYL